MNILNNRQRLSNWVPRVSFAALVVFAAALMAGQFALAERVLITELMYHPASENPKEEFIELHNPGTNAMDLTGWHFTTGVRFAFPPVTIPPGGYLAVAADLGTFATNHPTVTNVVGNWDGILSNSGQLLELVDREGKRVDEVRYADEGDWASRTLNAPDYGHRGLAWSSLADGGGRSLELISVEIPNKYGQNWTVSRNAQGTPGRPNSVAETDIAPLILGPTHFPIVPKSAEPVTITARIVDESTNGLSVVVHHRLDGAAAFASTPMLDDGQSGDGAAGDGVFGAVLAAQSNHAVVEFYIEARDAGGRTRRYPAPVSVDGTEAQTANLLYQVDDAAPVGNLPLYRLILRAEDLAELRQINSNNPRTSPFPTSDQTRSHAQLNATFISLDGQGTALHYNVGVRNRGNGSRSRSPQSFRVNFRNDQLWKNASAINLNSQATHAQLLGSALYRRAGLPTQSSRPVQVLVNNASLATSGSPSYGFYVCNEVIDSEFAGHVFPGDSSGNLYRGIRLTGNGADLHHEGTAPTPYRANYFKHSNVSEDDWSDLIELTRVLENEPDATYPDAVRRVVDVDEWMLYFALETLVDNRETNLGNGNNGTGEGDDYFLYSGRADRRFRVLPYDLDTILGQGDSRGDVNDSLFRMNANPVVARLMQHPEFAPAYYRQLQQLASTVFAPAQFDPLVDQTLAGLVPDSVIAAIKSFAAARREAVLGMMPTHLTATHGLPVANGYPRSLLAAVTLTGLADGAATRAVLVNGLAVNWSAWEGRWTAAAVALLPGINPVAVQAIDAAGQELERVNLDVWFDDGSVQAAGGDIAANTVWSATAGPYQIATSLTVATGATLTIQPGTTVYLGAGARLTVSNGGRLLAEGTENAPIRFTRPPGTSTTWGGIVINGGNGSPETRIAHAHIEFNGTTAIHSSGGTVFLDHLTFGTTDAQYISLDESSFVVQDCTFPAASAGFEPAHGTGGVKPGGHGLFLRNFFGSPIGYNDVIDFTGGNRPSPIVHFLGNVFAGASDDILDLDGTDAWVEGNIFLHAHKNGSPDSSSGVSGGSDGGRTSKVTVLGNLFFDCDQAATAKQGNFYTLLQNTIVHQTKQGGLDTDAGVLNFADEGTSEGAGMYLEGNIVLEAEKLTRNWTSANVTFTNNLLSLPWSGSGGGNSAADPLLDRVPVLTDTRFTSWSDAQIMWKWLRPRPGSPAVGSGINGSDRGGVIDLGVSVWGAPTGTTGVSSATLTVGPNRTGVGISSVGFPLGSGYTHYRWRLDGGEWSTETSIATPIELTGLAQGPHRVEVAGKRDSGLYQDDPLFGPLAITTARTWTVETGYVPPARSPLMINEVLAANRAIASGGSFPDLVELHNATAEPLDVGGMGLSTNSKDRYAFKFPAGTLIPANGYLVLVSDAGTNPPALQLGFALKSTGDALYLCDRLDRGSALLDSVEWGLQVADLSIGRLADGAWHLTQPTFGEANVAQRTGEANVAQRTGEATSLRINEWLAAGGNSFRDDFIELYNPDPLPVALDGLLLSDHPICPQPAGADGSGGVLPAGTYLGPLSFVAGNGFATLMADGQTNQGPGHLGFKLAAEQGVISLCAVAVPPRVTSVIDCIIYGPQQPDVSEGRTPNGAGRFAFFVQPSPGAGNPGATSGTNVTTLTVPLLAMTNAWRFWQNGDAGPGWRAPGFDDSVWAIGEAPLGHDRDSLPLALRTDLTLGKITYYFRSHFICPTNPAAMRLRLSTYIDDGAVFWLNGQLLHRQNLAAATPVYDTRADANIDNASLQAAVEVGADALLEGDNVLAVEVHQQNPSSGDIVFGLALEAAQTATNGFNPSVPILLNEVLARNVGLTNAAGAAPDWIELFNPTGASVDLADCSLSNDSTNPRRFIFPAGSVVPAGGYLVLECEGRLPASAGNTGFDLASNGGTVLFFDRPSRGGGLLDSIHYGLQIADFSIGRAAGAGNQWRLCLPTPNGANMIAATGNATFLRINEWMADPASGDDWFELFNPSNQPVELGGLFLTDDLNQRELHAIALLSFIGTGTNGFALFAADSSPAKGANHVDFKLAAGGESIGLFTGAGVRVDAVTFGVQSPGVAEGRLPDGTGPVIKLPRSATPARSNQESAELVDTDRDGLPDAWEDQFGLDRQNPDDAALDADADGLTNLEEFLTGTNPIERASTLRLNATRADSAGAHLAFVALAGRTYALEYRDALGTGAWQRLADIPPVTSETVTDVEDPNPPANGMRYYRLVAITARP